MTRIASAWMKFPEGELPYYSITPDKNLTPIVITEDHRFTLREIEQKTGNPNAPTHYLDMWKVKKDKTEEL